MKKLESRFTKIGTRKRITVPFDMWMDAKVKNLILDVVIKIKGEEVNLIKEYPAGMCLTKDMSYRFALPCFKRGDIVEIKPDKRNHKIVVEKAS